MPVTECFFTFFCSVSSGGETMLEWRKDHFVVNDALTSQIEKHCYSIERKLNGNYV